MKIGDLVRWKDDSPTVSMPPGYHNWEDVGVIVDYFDIDTVIVKWCSGEEFTVWMEDLEVISGMDDLTNL